MARLKAYVSDLEEQVEELQRELDKFDDDSLQKMFEQWERDNYYENLPDDER